MHVWMRQDNPPSLPAAWRPPKSAAPIVQDVDIERPGVHGRRQATPGALLDAFRQTQQFGRGQPSLRRQDQIEIGRLAPYA
jgi:hypothetical protein